MVITSPDGIRTPDTGDPFQPLTDLAIIAQDVQDALIERANAYKGTVAQRNGFAAPEGTLWVDTNGDKYLWQRIGASWVRPIQEDTRVLPVRMAAGTVSKATVNAGAVRNVSISFPSGRFSAVPIVTAAGWGDARDTTVHVDAVSTTGCTIRIGSMAVVPRTLGAQWTAVQMLTGGGAG